MVTIYSQSEKYVKFIQKQSHSTVSASEAEQPVIDSLPTDQNRCLSERYDITSHETLNSVPQDGQSNNQHLENSSKTSSAKKGLKKK